MIKCQKAKREAREIDRIGQGAEHANAKRAIIRTTHVRGRIRQREVKVITKTANI